MADTEKTCPLCLMQASETNYSYAIIFTSFTVRCFVWQNVWIRVQSITCH